MAWSKIKLKRQYKFPGLTFRKSGLYFNSEFISVNRLEDHIAVEFYRDDEDQYRLGFNFFLDETPSSLSILRAGSDKNSNGRTVKASALRSTYGIIDAECKLSGDPFPIQFDKFDKIFFVELKPNFNIRIKWSEIKKMAGDITGIYRYLDREKRIIYIGKGNIKERASEVGRKDWDVEYVEYSTVEDSKTALEWESYYIDEHIEQFGYKPTYNKVRGVGR